MKITERSLRIGAAFILALLFVGVAYALSGPSFLSRKMAEAGSTEELLKAYAAKDTDGDTLPDWQEALYGTDPKKADSNGDGMSDGEAARQGKLTPTALAAQLPSGQSEESAQDVLDDIPGVDPAPGSITEQFSHEFLQAYIEASGGQPMSAEDQQALVQKLLADVTAKAAASLGSSYAPVSVHTNSSIDTATYAASVERALTENDVPDEISQPLDLMMALIRDDDESAREGLVTVASTYQAMADQLKTVQVPPSLADTHVTLVRSLESLAKSTKVVASYEEDPLGTLGAFSAFKSGSASFSESIDTLATAILAGGEPQPGQPGYLLVSMARISAL